MPDPANPMPNGNGNAVALAQQQQQHPFPVAPTAPVAFSVFCGNADQFDLAQRMARALSSSDLVPTQYRDKLANCLIALDIANQRKISPLTVMQNMSVIQGRPAWSAQYIIASINACGQFSPLRFDWRGEEGADSWGCRAYAKDLASGDRLDGTWITIAMAKAEGWYGRQGSKWQTMPEQMLRYRAGAFFGRIYAPHVTLGLPTAEELVDSIIDVTPTRERVAPFDMLRPSAGSDVAPRIDADISAAAESAAAAGTYIPATPPPAPARRRGRPPRTPDTPAGDEAASGPQDAASAGAVGGQDNAPAPAPAAQPTTAAPDSTVVDTDPF
jgi:hypothetical protein